MSKQFGLKGNKIMKLSRDNTIYKIIKLKDVLNYINNNIIKVPKYQRELDQDKVDEIKNEIIKDDLYLLQRSNPIQLGSLLVGKKYIHYLIDGQHRIEALKLLDDNYLELDIAFVITVCNNELQVINLYKKLIRHLESYYVIDSGIIDFDYSQSLEFKFKELLKEHYLDYFVKGSKNEYVYTIDNYLLELKNKKFFDRKFNSDMEIKDYIFEKFNEYKKYNNYDMNVKNNPTIFYKKDLEYIIKTNNTPIASKKNNFIDYLCYDNIEPYHIYKKNKIKISKKLKNDLWCKIYGNKTSTNCIITNCNNIIEKDNYHAGHIISEYNNGPTEINNLYPICQNCNLKMNKKNWKEYDIDSYNKIENKKLKK